MQDSLYGPGGVLQGYNQFSAFGRGDFRNHS
jgi:hypothetical protein